MELENNSSNKDDKNDEYKGNDESLSNVQDKTVNSDNTSINNENQDTILEPQNKEEATVTVESSNDGEEEKSYAGQMVDYESITSSNDVDIPPLLIDQVIGHEEAVETIKKAAKQRRNVLLIGDPGVGKSMLAKGMAELLPPEVLQDVLVYPNLEDQNNPLFRTVPAGEDIKIIKRNKSYSKIYEAKK